MNELPLVRVLFETHVTSIANEAGVTSGSFDVALSSLGEEQGRAFGVRRQHDDLGVVVCSDLQRAFRTADIAFDGRGLRVIRGPRLRECDYGWPTRRPVHEVEAERRDHITPPFPDGESYEQLVRRVAAGSTRSFVTTLDKR